MLIDTFVVKLPSAARSGFVLPNRSVSADSFG